MRLAGLSTGCSSLQPRDLPSLLLRWIPSSELFCLPQALSTGLLLNNTPRETLRNSVDHHCCYTTTATTISRLLRNTDNSRHTCVLRPASLRRGSYTGLCTNSRRQQELSLCEPSCAAAPRPALPRRGRRGLLGLSTVVTVPGAPLTGVI